MSAIHKQKNNSMIFKTLNGDLTVFNKTLISTKDHLKSLQTINATVYNKNGAFNLQGLLVNSSQSVSTFTKLNNAFKAYNGNLSKSTQLQNAYVQAVGKQNVTLGNYLAGLNGAKASMGGYVKSLVAAKAASIGLQAASIALNTAISMGITLAISALISQISKWVHAQEEARQKAIELTNSYKEQKDSLDSQIEKYKELKETLDNGNLSTDETRSIKEQLLEIQKSLIESYGDEASNIDLVNGKYREQLGLLSELSKGKATDYVTENRDVFADAKEALEKIRTYNVGTVTSWNTYAPETEDQKKLIEYLETYSDLLDLTYSGASHGGVSATSVNLFVKANVANADELMHQLAEDLEKYGKDNNIDVSGLLEGISGQLKKTWTDELTDYKTVYDEFMKAEVVRNDTLRPLYQQSIQAVEDYNNALSSGEGIDKAKANLDSVQQSVQNATSELEGSQEVFDGIYDGINKYAEAAYQMSQAFENDEAVKGYAEQLKGLTDIDLKAINFEDNVQSPGEEAFKALIDILGLSEDEVQNLIDKLVELGYVQGEVQDSTSNIENPISSFQKAFDSLDTDIQQKLLDLAKSGEITAETMSSTEEYNTLLSQTGLSAESAKNQILDMLSIQEKLAGAANGLEKLKSSYEEFKDLGFVTAQSIESLPDAFKELEGYDLFSEIVGDPTQGKEAIQQAFNDIVKEYIFSQDTLQGLVDASESQIQSYIANLKEMGVTNAEEVVNTTIRVLNQENELLNAAEKEYMNYLEAKDGYDEEYIKSATSKNSQLVSALGDAYKGDYDNWCNLLSKKAQAYNKFVTSLKSASNTNSSGEPLSAKGQAEKIIRETNNGTKNVYDPSAKKGAGYFQANPKPGDYTKAQVDSAREYLKQYEEINKLKEELKFDLSTIDTNYGFDYSPKGRSDGKSGTDKKDTAKEETTKDFSETFDWIERRIKKFQRAFDKWLKQAETAVTSGFINKYYKKAFSSAKSQLSIYGKAYNRYMAEANAVDLDEKYAKKVRNGTIDLEEIRAHGTEEEVKKYEELAEKIKKYQDYYDKAQDSMNSFAETAEKLYNLPLDKAAKKVDLFSNNIDLLGKKLDNAVKLKTKNDFIDKQTKEEKKTLNAYTTARNDSRKQLNSAKKELRKKKNLNDDDGITKKERAKIKTAAKKNKEVNLALFTENSAGYKAAIKYNEALKANKKAINDAAAAQQDYNRWLVEASKLKFDNIADYYDKKIQMLNYDMDSLDRKVSEIEAKGKKVNKSYYESQKTVNNKILNQYKAEKEALEKNLKNIKKGTEEWYDAKDQIEQVKTAISDCTKETYDLNNAINQLHFDLFNDISEGISRIIKEQEFLRGLYAHEKNVDVKTGNFTDAGFANLGSLSASYYASKENAERDFAMLKDLQNVKKKGKQKNGSYKLGDWEFNSLDDLQKKIDETYTKWQEDIKETYNLESSIADGMKEKYQAELDMLQELINSKKEALNAEKDLHNYQRTLDEKTKNIATIQKQIAAYSGDTSQEGLAKLQKLQKELSDKEDDLRETEYDRYISDQQDMLDKLYTEYEELISKKLEDFMGLVKEGLQIANNNTLLISSYLKQVANENGYTQETKDLFMLLGADIKDGVLNSISNIVSNKESTSGTKEETKNNGNTSSKSSKNSTSSTINTPNIHKNKTVKKQDYRNTAESFIRTHVNKASKKKSEYSDINKAIYENKGGLYKGKGKVLSSNELKTLARKLLVEYDGDKSKKGALYKKLKSLKIPGFKKGGVVSIDDIEKQVRDNGDDGIVSIKNGEGILTKPETEAVQKLADHAEKQDEADKSVMINGVECIPVPIEDSLKNLIARSHTGMDVPNVDIVNAIKNVTPDLSNMIKSSIPNVQPNNNMDSTTNINLGGIIMNGVNDPKEFSKNLIYSIQKYPKVQKAVCSVSTNIIAGNGKISVNNIKQ